MNDTTRWIMIILLLLLIAAAVFMLLRSPGKDNGSDGDTMVGRKDAAGDTDTDTALPDAQERRIQPAGGTADRGVYDQEADTRAATAEDDRATMPAAERMDEYAHPDAVDDHGRRDEADARDEGTPSAPTEAAPFDATTGTTAPTGGATAAPVAGAASRDATTPQFEDGSSYDRSSPEESAEPYRPEAGAVEEDRPLEEDRAVQPAPEAATADLTDVHPLTDDEVYQGGREEPLTRGEQEPGAAPEDSGTAGSTMPTEATGDTQSYQQGTLHDDGSERPVGEESTTYRATGGEAVVVGEDRQTDEQGWTDTHAGPDTSTHTTTEPSPADWDTPPADTGTGAPQTADDIAAEGSQVGYAPVFTEAVYGPGSAEPLEDGSGPAGWEIKGNVGSMLFHTPESPSYDAIRAEVWFEDEQAARGAGFAHWDRRRR